MSDELNALLSGGAIGFIAAFVGGILSYAIYIRRHRPSGGPVIYVLAVTGALVLVGIIALILGVIVGEVGMALLTGVGVFVGFCMAFGLLLFAMARRSPAL
ncbi:MAG: hypothetical protein OHK0046_14180 [Anaerolineae bacterium]